MIESFDYEADLDRFSSIAVKTAKSYIRNNFSKLKAQDFDDFYSISEYNNVITLLLLRCGIDPLEYLSYIPYGFLRNTRVEAIEIPNNITKINSGAFNDCYGLNEIRIPESVTLIDFGAFLYAGLENIIVENKDCIINDRAFNVDISALKTCTLPKKYNKNDELERIFYAGYYDLRKQVKFKWI